MHGTTFLQDLAVVMIVAALVTVLFHRLKQPVVLGYILAGVIIGPHTPPFPLIHDEQTINTLSELGVILLMFSLGLEFSLRKLKLVGAPAVIAALLEILLLFWAGYEVGRLFGWRNMDSIFLGAMLSMSSTTVIIKVLGELGKMKEHFAQLIFGILIIEDILGIAMIALLSGIAMTGTLSVTDVGVTLGKLGIFLAVTLVIGLIAVPRLIGYVARFKSNEMLIVTVLGLCFGVSLLAVKLGYSPALGAFLIGAVVAEARQIHHIENLIEPVRDMFSAIFFVAIGLLIDPKMLLTYWQPILIVTLVVVVGKVATCSFGAFAGGNDTRTSLRVGMGLAQIGEFSFIIASLGLSLGVTSSFLYPIAVAVSAITTLTTPYLIRQADGLVVWFDRTAPPKLVSSLELYTKWVGRIGSGQSADPVRKMLRRWMPQLVLNVALVAGVFIAAAYLGRRPPDWMERLGCTGQWLGAGLWLTAVILSLPMIIATTKKLQALGMLIAETKVTAAAAGERTAAIRAVVANIVPIAGTVGLGLLILVLSSALLPPLKVLFVLLVIVGLVAWRMRSSFVKIYSKGQIALQETFAQEPEPIPEGAIEPKPSLLRDANLETIMLAAGAPAVGKLIRELELRSKTGASIIAIERNGVNLVNPGADEELCPDDQLLLIGTKSQLEKARNDLLMRPS